MEVIKKILDQYSGKDYKTFLKTVDILCEKGAVKGSFPDYGMFTSILQIFEECAEIIKNNKKAG